jgi:hypothetical protein
MMNRPFDSNISGEQPDPVKAIPDVPYNLADNTPSLESELERKSLDNARLNEELAQLKQANALRGWIPKRLWGLTLGWLLAVFLLVILGGTDKNFCLHLEFDQSVLIALITSTTATVIGMFAILLKYLFPSNAASS